MHTHDISHTDHAHTVAPSGEHIQKLNPSSTPHENLVAAAVPAEDPNTVTLDEPIKRGAQRITAVTLRRPTSGELRGVTLSALANLDVAALVKLIPRISSPMLTPQDMDSLDPADLLQLAQVVGGFLLPKHAKASLDLQTA